MALILVVMITVVILGAVTLVVTSVQTDRSRTDSSIQATRLDEAVKGGTDIGIERVWRQYLVANGGATGNMTSYLTFINGLVPNNEDTNGNGQQDTGETDANGNGVFESNPAGADLVGEADNKILLTGEQIRRIHLSRADDTSGTTITVTTTAKLGTSTKTGSQTLRVTGALFKGFDYGVLAMNVSCILCHCEIKPLDLISNTDATKYGTFDRIKVGSLQSIMVRTGGSSDPFSANSHVAGTTYSRGNVYNQSYGLMTAAQLASSTFDAYSFSSTTGKIAQSATGGMTSVSLSNATTNAQGKLNQNANLYLNYPTSDSLMTDGELPSTFPAPYNDANGNRLVDTGEFATVMSSATGSITGGVAYGVPSGSTYTGSGLPTTSNSATTSLASGSYDGNLILNGTAASPITIDGKVAVNGDLVLNGKVKGWGQLQVKGNVYIVGDTTYADAPGTFGVASDGTRNGLAVVAGGNIIMGDYLTRSALDKPSTTGVLNEYQVKTRVQHQTVTGGKDVGYYGVNVVDPGFTSAGETLTSFTSSELMVFNQREYQMAAANPSYKPRYYRIRPTQPVERYTGASQDAFYYTDPAISIISTNASTSILNLSPSAYWMTEAQLRDIWWADEQSRPSSGRAFQFDGLLYSNNAIFGLVRSNVRHGSYTMGQMVVRGSIISPDLGILAPGANDAASRPAFTLYYDRRVSSFYQIVDTTQATFKRLVYLGY